MSIVCIIPARGGSVRLPRKNWRDFVGKPMIAYAIEVARQSDLFDEVIVNTDHDDVALIAEDHGANVWRRPADEGSTGTQELAARMLDTMPNFEKACVIYPCVPLLLPMDLREAAKHLDASFVYAVGAFPLRDAGAFYFGWRQAFVERRQLVSLDSRTYVLPESRVCDINIAEDWLEAERKYKELKGIA